MWLQSIERRNGLMKARLIKDDGNLEWIDLEATWEVDIPVAGVSRISAKTCFSHWQLVDASEYLSVMDIDTDPAANRHQVFQVDYNGLCLVVPAILVIKALFRPSATVFEYLFRPSGIDMLLAPTHSNGSVSVVLIPQRLRQHVPVRDSSFERLRWLYCFPSARAAFNSVYTHATSGAVGVTLPNAEVDIRLKGRMTGNKIFASSLHVKQCAPLEASFDWAGRQPQDFRLIGRAVSEHLNTILTDSDLIEGPVGWELSNEEWARIEHLFPSGPRLRSGSQARAFIGAIFRKLGTGVGWASVNSEFGTTSAVSSFYRNCLRSKKWDKVIMTIMEMREQTSPIADAA